MNRERQRAALVVLAVLAAACRGVLVGDSEEVASELCAVLTDCEAVDPECATLEARFRDEPNAEINDGFLRHHARHDCTASCSNARTCRDLPPVCLAVGAGCEADTDCCGSTQGIGACRSGGCCVPAGAPCASSDDCCNGEACTAGRCGDVSCTLVGEGCRQNTDCCSRLCVDGACSARTCSVFGESCLSELDCCPTDATPLGCRDGVCQNPPDVCDSCAPVSDPTRNCCLESGQVCYVRVDETSFCGPDGGCAQPGVECGSNGDCCTGVCEESFFPHCCVPSGQPCLVDVECCQGGQCLEGACSL